MDKEKQSVNKNASIYPDPSRQLRNVSQPGTTGQEGKILRLTPYHIPWLKIAALGFGAFGAAFAALALAATLAHRTNVVVNDSVVLAIIAGVCLATVWTIEVILSKLDVRYATAIAGVATVAVVVVTFAYSTRLLSALNESMYGFPLPLLGTLLLLPLLTFITNKLPRPKVSIGILITLLLLLGGVAYTYKDPASVATRVSDVSWALTPGYLPAGIHEQKARSCAFQRVTDDFYECSYYFAGYPGYLSETTQKKIQALYPDSPGAIPTPPSPFFQVGVARNTQILKQYQFNEGTCDIDNMREVANTTRKYRASDAYTHKPRNRPCVQITTPEGKVVWYESPANNPKDAAQVPMAYYFVQSGTIVMIRVGKVPTDSLGAAHYVTDPGFDDEVYKFIDGFK